MALATWNRMRGAREGRDVYHRLVGLRHYHWARVGHRNQAGGGEAARALVVELRVRDPLLPDGDWLHLWGLHACALQ
eukprot:760273-Hanusia_phi.AAC.1